MNSKIQTLLSIALFGAAFPLLAAPALVPNAGFETPNGATWAEGMGGGTFVFRYPDSGGNPGGYGVIDHTANNGGFGIWVANGSQPLVLATLGLTAGKTYLFSQDMRILSGTKLGGFKVDFFTGSTIIGSTGERFPALIGNGSTWERYTFKVNIPAAADGIKLVPLWGAGSSIGYDNICVDPTPVPVPPIPNGNFDDGNASWFESGAPNTTFSYPASGGNPGPHGIMTNNGRGFGIWVANGGAPLVLGSLGLAGGDTVMFFQDMRIVSGSNLGGLKVEFLNGATFLGDTGDMIPAVIGNGSTWETYSFEVTIPSGADRIKVVPLWGLGSSVAYDNFTFSRVIPLPLALEFALGTAVSWEATSEVNRYQAQKSANGSVWTNLGPVVVGNAIRSAFDPERSPFYRVLETPLGIVDAVINGGFETAEAANPLLAESWNEIGTQPPTRVTSDFRSGTAGARIRVVNSASGAANTSELNQSIAGAGGAITPGSTYDFSFWAKQVTSGVSYVQQFRIQWLAAGGAILSGGTEFSPFSGGTGEWAEIKVAGLVAPPTAATAFIQIFGATGAVAGSTAQGEVLIDEVRLVTTSTGPSAIEAVLNGEFEFLDPENSSCSEFWICAGTQPPTNIVDDSRSGIASMELRVQNSGSPTPNSSEIRHDIFDAGGAITPGSTHDFSFWAKQVTSGVSYVQQYRLRWLDGGGAELPGGIGLTSFPANSADWTEIKVAGLVAPAAAVTAVIQVIASTGAVAGPSAGGTVLIDDVSLAAVVEPDVLPASAAAGLQISWATEAGQTYQLMRSLDLNSFEDFGPPITGDGGVWSATDLITTPARFYQVEEIAP